MKFDELIRGPSSKKIKLGRTGNYTRIGMSRKYPMLRSIRIDYTPVDFTRRYLFPWVEGFQTTIWHMKVVVETKSGRRFEHKIISESDLQIALEYGSIQGIALTLLALREEIQKVPRRSA